MGCCGPVHLRYLIFLGMNIRPLEHRRSPGPSAEAGHVGQRHAGADGIRREVVPEAVYRDEWLLYGGRWFVFDASGKMITGWFKASEGWYYLAGDGAMCASQWICDDDGKSYYVTRTGLMATSCYVRSNKPYRPGSYIYYWVGKDGAWDPQWDTEKPDLKKYYCAE